MSIKYAILGILSQGDLHGYELKSSFDEKVGEFWSLKYGQIYSTLDRIDKEHLVTHDRQEQEKRSRESRWTHNGAPHGCGAFSRRGGYQMADAL